MDSKAQKKALRDQLIKKRDALSDEYRRSASGGIFTSLRSWKPYRDAKGIFTYVSFRSEPDTHDIMEDILADGRSLFVPRTRWEPKGLDLIRIRDRKELKVTRFGLHEPEDHLPPALVQEIDLVLVPGLSFTLEGGRIGYGAGFYDHFLSELSKDIPTVGMVFEEMISNNLPMESHDRPVQYILSEKGIREV